MLLMVAAALCMACFNVWSRPYLKRFGAMTFTALAMTIGAAALAGLSWARGGFHAVEAFGAVQWSGVAFLGVFGGAITFLLWSFALSHTTPTRVAISVTVNPIMAALFGKAVLAEPIAINLIAGLMLVAMGIALATRRNLPLRLRRAGSARLIRLRH